MLISHIHIVNYKNYEDVHVDFHPQFNVITGYNGEGKTNLIDAIHYLGLTRSYFLSTDTHNYRHESDFFRLDGLFVQDETEHRIVCKTQKRKSKVFEKDAKKYERLVDHIGLIPIVMIAPKDGNIINEGSVERRRIIDTTISQLDSDYLDCLMEYNYILKQRNQLLKSDEEHRIDLSLLDVYDQKLSITGSTIFDKRKAYLEELKDIFLDKYEFISGGKEISDLTYKSKLSETALDVLLKENRKKDLILQRTSAGVHKDDLVFLNNGSPIKFIGSQGQQKSFVLALKLAQFELIKKHRQVSPIILLDDIFDKLDSSRVMHLIKLLNNAKLGQIFITDTEKDRLNHIFEELNFDFALYEVTDNQVLPVTL